MKRKWILGITMVCSAMFFCSCGYEESITINKNGTATMTMASYTTPEEEGAIMTALNEESEPGDEMPATFAELMKELEFQASGQTTLNGKIHNKYVVKEKMSKEMTDAQFVLNNSHQSVMNVGSTAEMKEMTGELYKEMGIPEGTEGDLSVLDKFTLTIKYPFKVSKTNGTKLSDGYTVTYDMRTLKADRIYAADSKAAKNRSLKVLGVKNKAYYDTDKTVSLATDGVITQFRVNGDPMDTNSYQAKKDGKYKLSIKMASGVSRNLSFTVDKTKPKTNIKNKQTYKGKVTVTCSDKTSGIKKITLNGKKIANNKVVSKKGSYELQITDKAGNVKKVRFTIK